MNRLVENVQSTLRKATASMTDRREERTGGWSLSHPEDWRAKERTDGHARVAGDTHTLEQAHRYT